MKDLRNTVAAMADWLAENAECHLLITGKGEDGICAVNGNGMKLSDFIADCMTEDSNLKNLIINAAQRVMIHDIAKKLNIDTDKLKIDDNDTDI